MIEIKSVSKPKLSPFRIMTLLKERFVIECNPGSGLEERVTSRALR
jgi:hypothetical protein